MIQCLKQSNTIFSHSFLLCQYSFICVQYFTCSDTYAQYFFWQLLNKKADCFNNIVFILVTKISSKNVCGKMENNSTLEKVILVCNSNAELLRLVASTFDFKLTFLTRMRKKKFDNYEKFAEKEFAIFCFICLSFLTLELLNINWKRSENFNTLNVLLTVLYLKFFCIIIEQ